MSDGFNGNMNPLLITVQALVAGCNLIYGLTNTLKMTNMNFLSPDSKCFSFDHRANGYARGEGAGVVVLKTLTDAIADGDVIRGIIRSTGCNQDGHTPGITQPSTSAQVALIEQTYRKAGLELDATRFFEGKLAVEIPGLTYLLMLSSRGTFWCLEAQKLMELVL